jgi:quercetin 2,3-dioxygenase
LRRSISPRQTNEYDPFLLFDHFAFNNPLEGPIRGFPMHPHRGIETVTYILDGSVNHRDSLGNSGVIGPGDVQWMTSGRGILHEEMPRRGPSGNIYGFQLWVNLPAAQKMSQPRYQEVNSASIPAIEKDGATIRLVAGEIDGTHGPVTEIAASPLYMDVKLAPASKFSYPIPSGHTALAYVFEGAGEFSGEAVESVSMAVFNDDGDHIEVRTERSRSGETGVRFMLITGAPFKEPIVPYGPFVMNTAEEIQQALADLRNGTFVK